MYLPGEVNASARQASLGEHLLHEGRGHRHYWIGPIPLFQPFGQLLEGEKKGLWWCWPWGRLICIKANNNRSQDNPPAFMRSTRFDGVFQGHVFLLSGTIYWKLIDHLAFVRICFDPTSWDSTKCLWLDCWISLQFYLPHVASLCNFPLQGETPKQVEANITCSINPQSTRAPQLPFHLIHPLSQFRTFLFPLLP